MSIPSGSEERQMTSRESEQPIVPKQLERNVSTIVRQLFEKVGGWDLRTRVFKDCFSAIVDLSGETEDGSAGTQPSEG